MFAFMGRVGTLGDLFSREDAIASIVAKPCHEAVATRAQVLDYFAWAARHGLLVEATAAEIAAASGAAARSNSAPAGSAAASRSAQDSSATARSASSAPRPDKSAAPRGAARARAAATQHLPAQRTALEPVLASLLRAMDKLHADRHPQVVAAGQVDVLGLDGADLTGRAGGGDGGAVGVVDHGRR